MGTVIKKVIQKLVQRFGSRIWSLAKKIGELIKKHWHHIIGLSIEEIADFLEPLLRL